MLSQYSEKLQHFYSSHKRMPTYAEMAKLFGFKSKNAVYKVVNKLVDAGAVAKDHIGRLVPTKLFGEVKMLGLVEAGIPSPTEEEVLDTMNLDEWLVNNRESTFLLRVKGDSMIDAGIFEGDYVLAERTDKHKTGDIVIGYVDGEWTLKYLGKNAQGYYLKPGNKRYSDIYPAEELKVAAVVRSVIRKLKN